MSVCNPDEYYAIEIGKHVSESTRLQMAYEQRERDVQRKKKEYLATLQEGDVDLALTALGVGTKMLTAWRAGEVFELARIMGEAFEKQALELAENDVPEVE